MSAGTAGGIWLVVTGGAGGDRWVVLAVGVGMVGGCW